MSVTNLGNKTLGAAVPGVQTLSLPSLNAYVSELASKASAITSQLATYSSLSATLATPEIVSSMAAALGTITSQLTTLAAGVLPSVGTASLNLRADLLALNITLDALRSTVSTLTAAASAGGVHVFAVDSKPKDVGGELNALVGGGMPGGGLATARIQGVMLLTESPATYAAMSGLMLTG